MTERIKTKLRSFKEKVTAEKNEGMKATKTKTKPAVDFFARVKRERAAIAKC